MGGESADEPVGRPEYPQYLLDRYASLTGPPLNLPPTIPEDYILPSSSSLTRHVILQHIYFLLNDFPEFFVWAVDTWLEEEEKRHEEDARFGVTFQRRLRAQYNPAIRFEHILKEALAKGRAAALNLTQTDQRWDPDTNGGLYRDQRDPVIQHADSEKDDGSSDEDWAREVSPSPMQRPPTPVSNPSSPSKRSSDAGEQFENLKRFRNNGHSPSRSVPANRARDRAQQVFGGTHSQNVVINKKTIPPLLTISTFNFSPSEIEAPPFVALTPKLSLVISPSASRSEQASRPTTPAPERSLHISHGSPSFDQGRESLTAKSKRSLFTSPKPLISGKPTTPFSPSNLELSGITLDDQLDVDMRREPKDTSWKPVPARDEHEQTVLVLPRNQYQVLIWKRDIKFHVQWEIERRIAQDPEVTWDDLHSDDMKALMGSVREALPKVELVMQVARLRAAVKHTNLSKEDIDRHVAEILGSNSTASSDAVKQISTEADREETSIRRQDGQGMYSDEPDWQYGGKLIYTVYVRPIQKSTKVYEQSTYPPIEVHRSDSGDVSGITGSQIEMVPNGKLPFSMELRPPTMTGKSFHLARKYGSRRILHFKFAEIYDHRARQAMFDLFQGRRLVLVGRVFRAWSAATDKNVLIAIEVKDAIPRITIPSQIPRLDPVMPSFLELLESSNDLKMKPGQAMAKWAARPQLLLSDTYPAVQLKPDEVAVIDDIVVSGLAGPPTTEQTLTDGCGLMTEAVARQIGLRLPSSLGRPCVVQMRLMGAKGLLVLMTPEQEELHPGKSVLLRKSMVKSLTRSEDPSRYIIEIVRCGNNVLKTSATLPAEAIIALSSRQVPGSVLLDKAKIALDELRTTFDPNPSATESSGEALRRLSAAIYRTGGVGTERRKRECVDKGISLRVAGVVHDHQDKADLDVHETVGIKNMSGQPFQAAESVYMAIDAGFDPRKSAYACRHLHRHVEQQVENLTKDFRIPVQQSMSAYIIPDSLGLLGPHEIFVAFSGEGPIDPNTGCPVSHLSGPVLAFRSPCKLPTDIQPYMAVYRPELRHLKDCIVMSASSDKCRQSPASFLAGGDYDGDMATIIFDSAIVEPFVKADDNIANIPAAFEKDNFEKELIDGTAFLEALSGDSEEAMIRNYQTFLLGALLDAKITGQYSVLHDNAVYTLGHEHPETIRLARMFSLVLDARKSGLRVKPEALRKDRLKYSGHLEWRAFKQDKEEDGSKIELQRDKGLIRFIMDDLMINNHRKGKEVMAEFPSDVPIYDTTDYQHLSALYLAKVKQVEDYGNDVVKGQLEVLTFHVTSCYSIWNWIRLDMLPKAHTIQELYEMSMSAVSIPPGKRAQAPRSPQKRGAARPENIVREAHKRELARLWHEALVLEDVSGLCADIQELRRLTISCSATLPEYKKTQLFPFDVDFPTTLQLKAEKVGPTLTSTMDAMMAKKPTYRPVKG